MTSSSSMSTQRRLPFCFGTPACTCPAVHRLPFKDLWSPCTFNDTVSYDVHALQVSSQHCFRVVSNFIISLSMTALYSSFRKPRLKQQMPGIPVVGPTDGLLPDILHISANALSARSQC